jgi:kynurenine formamidase
MLRRMDAARAALLAPAIALLACASAPRAPLPPGRVVDLTHPFDATTIYWPTEEGFVHERGFAGRTAQGHWYEAHRFHAAEHGGTHLDAPVHFAEGRRSVDAIPADQLLGPAVVVDASAACARDRDHRIGVDELEAFEVEHGRIPEAAIVLLRTGFGRFWPDRAAYLGTDERGPGAVAKLRFPGLSPEAARWLADERRIAAVGIDTASLDFGRSTGFETHQVLAEREIPGLENVAHLDELPATGAFVVALPMKIRGGSGAPLRIVAIVPDLP